MVTPDIGDTDTQILENHIYPGYQSKQLYAIHVW